MRPADLLILGGLALVWREARRASKAGDTAALAALAARDDADDDITDLAFWRKATKAHLASKLLGLVL